MSHNERDDSHVIDATLEKTFLLESESRARDVQEIFRQQYLVHNVIPDHPADQGGSAVYVNIPEG